MDEPKLVGDEHMGAWVYCKQHLRSHATGWCTVDASDKIALEAKDGPTAREECRAKGLDLYGEEAPGHFFRQESLKDR